MVREKIKENRTMIIAYFIYGFIWLMLHMECIRYGDDLLWAERALSINSFGDFMNNYCEHISGWSSRIVIDFIGRVVELSPMIIWRVLDSAVMVLLTLQLDKLFNEEKSIKFTLFIMSACFIYPFIHMSSAGWMATTFTYLWPLAFLLYAVRVWKDGYEGKKVFLWQYILSALAYIYAIDQQQVAITAALLCAVILFLLRREIKPSYIAVAVLTVLRVLLHLKWPGSESRNVGSISTSFPDFGTLSLLDKVQIGASTAFEKVFFEGDMVFFLTGLLLAVLVFEKYKDLLHRGIILLPNIIFFLWGPFRSLLPRYFLGVYNSYAQIYNLDAGYSVSYGMINSGNYFAEKPYFAFFLCGLGVICLIVSILAVYGLNNTSVLYSAVLVIGFCSRIVMGFSPTVYVSGSRTYLFLYFAFIVLMIAFAKKIRGEQEKKANWALGIICFWGVMSLANLWIQIPWVK